MEDKDELKRRVYDAAETIANGQVKRSKEEALNQWVIYYMSSAILSKLRLRRRICISPQCGFASHSEGNNVNEDVMKQKLTLVVETAREIWSY